MSTIQIHKSSQDTNQTNSISDKTSEQKQTNKEKYDISDEEDEDYIPSTTRSDEEDNDADQEIMEHEPPSSTSRLSLTKKRAVDEAFASLFGSTQPSPIDTKSHTGGKKKTAKKAKKATLQKKKVLTELFGSKEASKLLSTAKAVVSGTDQSALRSAPLDSYLPKKSVVEVKKFAGQTMEVRRIAAPTNGTTSASCSSSAPTASASTKSSSLDALLKEMAGPSKISTVEKTASDWEVFKDETELKDELETKAKGKDAFLEKKSFLQRVDLRRFDREKAQRDMERYSRGN